MTLKHKSDGFRYGDTNPSHVLAVKRVYEFWNKFYHPRYGDWQIDVSWVEQYSEKFVKENKMEKSRQFFFHLPDLVLFEWREDQPILRLVIEIDGESHSAKSRKIADGLFKEWINRRYQGLGVKLIRLQKAELEGPLDLAHEYLRDKLGEYLK